MANDPEIDRDERCRHLAVAAAAPALSRLQSWSRFWCGAIAVYISPRSLRELRDSSAQVRADILTNIVQPGRFTSVGGGGLTFHIADRQVRTDC